MEAQSFGRIVEYDPKNKTGVIEQYDGMRAIFHANDLDPIFKEMGGPQRGQQVLCSFRENELGSIQAYDIQIIE